MLFDQLSVSNPFHLDIDTSNDLDTFTYGFAIEKLWKAENLASPFGSRLAAVVLVLFSGIWPHVKLLALHAYWYAPAKEEVRTNVLYWLSTFGKWSLADVFVVCVMIGVLNLDLMFEPERMLEGLKTEILEAVYVIRHSLDAIAAENYVCESVLNMTCGGFFNFKCKTCKIGVGYLYAHPDLIEGISNTTLNGITPSGHGAVLRLRIGGLHGIYVFCFAVIISLCLSFLIDLFDHHAKASNAKVRRGMRSSLGAYGSPGVSSSNLQDAMSEEYAREPPPVLLIRRISRRVWSVQRYAVLCMVSVLAVVLVCAGVFYPSMERNVSGSLPQISGELLDGGVQWNKSYSMWELSKVTGAAGGADILLMGTFGFFCVLGPLLRGVICVIDLMVPASKSQHKRLLTFINFLGAFCAWEVFLVALLLVDMEMPQLTNTIVDDRDTPVCKILHDSGNFSRSCFQVEYVTLSQFAFVMLGGSLLLLVSTLTSNLGFKALDPYHDGDKGGPYCFQWCPRTIFNFDADEDSTEYVPI